MLQPWDRISSSAVAAVARCVCGKLKGSWVACDEHGRGTMSKYPGVIQVVRVDTPHVARFGEKPKVLALGVSQQPYVLGRSRRIPQSGYEPGYPILFTKNVEQHARRSRLMPGQGNVCRPIHMAVVPEERGRAGEGPDDLDRRTPVGVDEPDRVVADVE